MPSIFLISYSNIRNIRNISLTYLRGLEIAELNAGRYGLWFSQFSNKKNMIRHSLIVQHYLNF